MAAAEQAPKSCKFTPAACLPTDSILQAAHFMPPPPHTQTHTQTTCMCTGTLTPQYPWVSVGTPCPGLRMHTDLFDSAADQDIHQPVHTWTVGVPVESGASTTALSRDHSELHVAELSQQLHAHRQKAEATELAIPHAKQWEGGSSTAVHLTAKHCTLGLGSLGDPIHTSISHQIGHTPRPPEVPRGADFVMQWVQLLFEGVPTSVPAAPFSVHLPVNAYGRAGHDGLSTWALTTRVGDPSGVPGSWLQPGLCIYLGSEPTNRRSSLPLSFCLCPQLWLCCSKKYLSKSLKLE